MVKRVVWTHTAKKARREILDYWIKHNDSSVYSKKLSKLFRIKVSLLATNNYIGKPTDFENVRVSLVSHFSIFYKINSSEILIVGIWDNRRNPDDLHQNLEL
jgi:plasmid stabilization system protein ParE